MSRRTIVLSILTGMIALVGIGLTSSPQMVSGSGLARQSFTPLPNAAAQIAFVSERDSYGSEIYVVNADGSNPRNLTQHDGGDGAPAWSPDGSRIDFLAPTAHLVS